LQSAIIRHVARKRRLIILSRGYGHWKSNWNANIKFVPNVAHDRQNAMVRTESDATADIAGTIARTGKKYSQQDRSL